METCDDTCRRKACVIYINSSLAHYGEPLIPTPIKVDFSKLYTHLETCRDAKCQYELCEFISPFIFHLNNCFDDLCPFCSVIQNFERKRLVTAIKIRNRQNLKLEQDLTYKIKQ